MLNIFSKFFSGSNRTQIVKKNIAGSFLIKGLSLIVSLALVPLTINLLDQEKYGVWMTIFSIVSWFNLMDIGVGNGFRNKFAEAVALDNKDLAKEYVKTLYSSIFLIALGFFVAFSVINFFLDWNKVLNLPLDFDEDISLIVWIVFGLFCLQLYAKNISLIFLSLQKTNLSNLLIFLGNILALVFIYILHITNQVSLFSIAIAFMLAPVVVFLFASSYSFSKKLKIYKPAIFSLPEKKYLNDIIGLGLKFFMIQVAAIFMYGTGNLIITQLFGPAEVTPYNVAFRLFSSTQVFFSVIITPFWSAFTEANTKNDNIWIKKSIKVLIYFWLTFSVGVVVFWIVSPFIFKIWVGDDVVIPISLSLQFCVFVIINSGLSIFISFLSGIGKIAILFYCSIFQCIVYVPLAIFLAREMNLDSSGVILSVNIILLTTLLIIIYQTRKIIIKSAIGLWNK
jgi:O-antigen/teichoic acid export membrane protein